MGYTPVRRQYRHATIDPDFFPWYDLHFGNRAFDGWLQIGWRGERSSGVQMLYAGSVPRVQEFLEQMHVSGNLDYYIMCNQVKTGAGRKSESLFSLQNIVLDIDCHAEEVDEYERAEMLEDIVWRLEHDMSPPLPCPSSTVWTGRGLQLWWALVPVHAKCRPYYDEVKNYFILRVRQMLEENGYGDLCEVDVTASKNPVGFYRLPYSVNTATGAPVRVEISGSAPVYVLQDLVALAKEGKASLAADEPPAPAVRAAGPDGRDAFAGRYSESDIYLLRNYHTFGFFRMKQLIQLRLIRDDAIGDETRNNLCFMAYNAMLPALGHDAAWAKLLLFNQGFKQPMTEKELEGVICSARDKGGYRYSNEKMIEFLEITPAEQERIGLYATEQEFQPRVRVSGNPSRNQSRKLIKEDRNRKIRDLADAGKTIPEIARALSISYQTVKSCLDREGVCVLSERDRRIQELASGGATQTAIAAAVGVDRRTVSRALRKLNSVPKI